MRLGTSATPMRSCQLETDVPHEPETDLCGFKSRGRGPEAACDCTITSSALTERYKIQVSFSGLQIQWLKLGLWCSWELRLWLLWAGRNQTTVENWSERVSSSGSQYSSHWLHVTDYIRNDYKQMKLKFSSFLTSHISVLNSHMQGRVTMMLGWTTLVYVEYLYGCGKVAGTAPARVLEAAFRVLELWSGGISEKKEGYVI